MRLNRLVNLNAMTTYTLEAVDGKIGKLEQVYFDNCFFTIRYLLVNTGEWLSGRKILLSPFTVGDFDRCNQILFIELTQAQVEHSPPIGDNLSVSREYEVSYFKYYGWPPYWESSPWPNSLPLSPTYASDFPHEPSDPNLLAEQNHLLSSHEIQGYRIGVKKGSIGHVKSFIIDTQYWTIRYLEVDTQKWLHNGNHVLISPAWIDQINWPDQWLSVDLAQDALQNVPKYDEKKPIDRDYEQRLFSYYGKKIYWK